MLEINKLAPDFETEVFHENQTKKMRLSGFRGKWIVLFFYPKDFTFVCPTELGDLANNYEMLRGSNVEILSVSTDTVEVHKAWHNASDTIKKIKFPMIADPTGNICRAYGTYIREEGVSLRGTFIIDPDGILKIAEINDNDIGRSTKELIRKIKAAQFVRENHGQVCPVNWEFGQETLRPGLDLVGKI